MSFPRYPEYRESGVDWPMELPARWTASRLGNECWVRARLGWKGLKAEEYVDDGHVLLSTPNIKGRDIDFVNVNFISDLRYEESPEIKLRVGDVLLAKDGSTLGTVNIVRCLPRSATVNSSIAVISPGGRLDPVFLHWFLASSSVDQTIQLMKGGMGVPHLFQSDLVKFFVPLPPKAEQQAIAVFLDRETAKIDGLVAEQERLIELLKEKRQAVISHAVTKGLNPSAPMRDSGIEWLGQVPAHWEVRQLKHAVRSIEQGWSPQCEGVPADWNREWGVLKVGCVNGGTFAPSENKLLPADLEAPPELALRRHDLLISRANTRELVGSAAVVPEDFPRLLLCDKLYRLRLDPDACLPVFVAHFLGSPSAREQIELSATGASSSMLNIGQGAILNLPLPLPPVAEQEAILEHLRVRKVALDALMQEAERAVDLLGERRTALISAAVTGQIDVRPESMRTAA